MSNRKDIRRIFNGYELESTTLDAGIKEKDRLRRIKERNEISALNNPNIPIYPDENCTSSSIKDDYLVLGSRDSISSLSSKSPKFKSYDQFDSIHILADDQDPSPKDKGLVENVETRCLPIVSFGTHQKSELSTNVSSKHSSMSSFFISNSVYLLPHLACQAKPHQFEGLRFLYDNIIEDVNSFNPHYGGFGCILAHSMGLGKTFQSISFIELFLRCTASTHVLIAAPVNTLHNWKREFDLWLPPLSKHIPRETSNMTHSNRNFQLFTITEQEKTFKQRFKVLLQWKQDAGVLIIGYELFRNLVGLHVNLSINRKQNLKKYNPYSKEVFEILCDPGPDLVICDEGHRIKNDEAAITHAIKCIRTRRRIVLTGYPLQNNLLEYWCMIDFVRPSYLGSKKEFKNLFLRPIENGQCQNSVLEDVRLMLQRSHVLHHMLLGIVQRKCEKTLAQNVPLKHEFILFTSLSHYQARLYDVIVNDLREEKKINSSINPLLAFAICCKIWNHPEILYEIANRCSSTADLNKSLFEDEREMMQEVNCKNYYNLVSDPDVVKNCFVGYESEILDNGPKFLILFDILDSAISLGEKVLIFSQSIPTLNLLERFLSKSYVPYEIEQNEHFESAKVSYSAKLWEIGYNYLRLDGSSTSLDRHHMTTNFNDPLQDKIKLFLISTRAGSLGINLVAASRIVILDVSWNPCHDAQAVCRAFRFGQKRECFVYRLIADGTFESKMYKRQISKISTSERVLDNLKPQRVVTKEDLFTAITLPVQQVTPIQNLASFSGEFNDQILKRICKRRQGILTQPPMLHRSFFVDSSDDHLNDTEKKEASTFYYDERELCRLREINSREKLELNPFILTEGCSTNKTSQTPIDYSSNRESRTVISKKYKSKSNAFENTVPYITPNLGSESPISIRDSDEDIPFIELDSSDTSTIHSPITIDLVDTEELFDESTFPNVSEFYMLPPMADHKQATSHSDPQNETIIIILDSPDQNVTKNTMFCSETVL